MNKLNTTLKSVPAITKQELLFHIAEHFPAELVKITIDAGLFYEGLILSVGKVKNEEVFLVLQITDERKQVTNRFVHLSLHKIAAIELIEPADLINILSQGKKTKGEQYEASGKLAVQRGFQSFSETIFNTHAVAVGVPTMELPADGLQLNRILKLTQKIQQVILELFKEEDARISWNERYNKIVFINNDTLSVKGVNNTVEIHFSFDNINAPEIAAEDLTTLLMGIL
jgi:hypothetical protein